MDTSNNGYTSNAQVTAELVRLLLDLLGQLPEEDLVQEDVHVHDAEEEDILDEDVEDEDAEDGIPGWGHDDGIGTLVLILFTSLKPGRSRLT